MKKRTITWLLIALLMSSMTFSFSPASQGSHENETTTINTISELYVLLNKYKSAYRQKKTRHIRYLRLLNRRIKKHKRMGLKAGSFGHCQQMIINNQKRRLVSRKRFKKIRRRFLHKINYLRRRIIYLKLTLTDKPVGVFMDNPYTDLPYFENLVGHRLQFFLWYQSIIENFDANLANWLWERGTTLELAFEPRNPSKSSTNQSDYQLRDITAGNHDADLIRWARQLKNFGKPVYFRPMCEMNGNWTSWSGDANGNLPSDYIPAWRHIYNIFQQEGASNVIFVWAPNRDGDTATAYKTFKTYYPGSAYVDYIGINGYNWGTMYDTSTWTSTWQSFSQVFGPSYKIYTTYTDKPLMISEMASTDVGGSKAEWIKDAYTQIKLNYPRLKITVWFNVNKETDWRIYNSSNSLQAFINYAL